MNNFCLEENLAQGRLISLPEGLVFLPDGLKLQDSTHLYLYFFEDDLTCFQNFQLNESDAVHIFLRCGHSEDLDDTCYCYSHLFPVVVKNIEDTVAKEFGRSSFFFQDLGIFADHSGLSYVRSFLLDKHLYSRVRVMVIAHDLTRIHPHPVMPMPDIWKVLPFIQFAQDSAMRKKWFMVYKIHSGKTSSLASLFQWIPALQKWDSLLPVRYTGNFFLIDQSEDKQDMMGDISSFFQDVYQPPCHTKSADYYRGRLLDFAKEEVDIDQKNTVFIGDSLTERFPFDVLLPEHPIYNRGIQGDKVGGYRYLGILDRLYESAYDLNPGKIFLMVGVNDLIFAKTPKDIFIQCYRRLITEIRTYTQAEIHIQSILPVRDRYKRFNGRILDFNKALKEMAFEMRVPFIDLFASFHGSDKYLKPDLSMDGLHLSDNGYQLWTEKVKPFL